jgi:hypothetical protein
MLVLHLHQHQSSRNLHMQYLAKNQSTQRCQSLITQGSDHPPVLEPHMVLSSSARFRPTLHGSRMRLDNSSRLLCHLRHKFFYGGGWVAASISRLAHCLPGVSFPLVNGVGWWNLLREPRIQLSAYTILHDKYSTTLLEELTS